jgi:hypothetical protein
MYEKSKSYLKDSAKHLQISDHMTYVTFPIVNEKRLILKIFEEIAKSINSVIDAAIDFEFTNQNLILHQKKENNIINFLDNLNKKYNLNKEDIEEIKEILYIEKKYKESSIDFVKQDKVVIMSDDLNIHTLTIEKIKDYLIFAKNLFLKISSKIK